MYYFELHKLNWLNNIFLRLRSKILKQKLKFYKEVYVRVYKDKNGRFYTLQNFKEI